MIFKDDETTVIQFGTGDIEVAGGMIDDPEETIGTLSFTPQNPAPIGETSERFKASGGECLVEDYAHTRLLFTKIESLDIVITHLLRARRFMAAEFYAAGKHVPAGRSCSNCGHGIRPYDPVLFDTAPYCPECKLGLDE